MGNGVYTTADVSIWCNTCVLSSNHSLANRHNCLTSAKTNMRIDIDSDGPTAERMINQQMIFVYP